MKTVLITGCSRPAGFGQLTARHFAQKGFKVFAGLRRRERADSLLHWASEHGFALQTIELDVNKPSQNRAAIQQIRETEGRLDVLVNNAGMSSFGALESLKDEHIRHTMETNFFSAVDLTRAALPLMRERQTGRIIFVSSLAGVIGIPGESIYCASKYALEGMAQALALELRRFGIDVSTVRPAFFSTGMSNENTDASDFYDDLEVYRAFNEQVIRSTSDGEAEGEDPALVAETIYQAATSETPKPHWLPGEAAPALSAARKQADDSDWQAFTMQELGMSEWF